MNYCCQAMKRSIERKEMDYDPIRACFLFYIKDEAYGGENTFHQKVCAYCPYCGEKLHKDLFLEDEYYDALEEAVGKEYCDIKEEEIPKEFKSDEWWKKRGL